MRVQYVASAHRYAEGMEEHRHKHIANRSPEKRQTSGRDERPRPGSGGPLQRASGGEKIKRSLESLPGVRSLGPSPTGMLCIKESRKDMFGNIGTVSEELKLYMGDFGKIQSSREETTETKMWEHQQLLFIPVILMTRLFPFV